MNKNEIVEILGEELNINTRDFDQEKLDHAVDQAQILFEKWCRKPFQNPPTLVKKAVATITLWILNGELYKKMDVDAMEEKPGNRDRKLSPYFKSFTIDQEINSIIHIYRAKETSK